MRSLSDRVQAMKGRSPSPAQGMLAGFARNAVPRHRDTTEDGRRSRRADALNRLPESVSPAMREFVSSQFDAGRDFSHAVVAAVAEGRRSVRAAPRTPSLTAEERLLCSRLGISEADFKRYNA